MTDAPLINRAAVIRLYPNREQAGALRRWQGGIRKVWNETLDWCFKQREAGGKWPNQRAIQSFMVGLQKQPGFEWIVGIPPHAILALAEDMMRALKNWFEKRTKRPRFCGKFQRQFSVYMVNQATTLLDGAVKLPKLGTVRFRGGELPQGRLLSSRIYREADKWCMAAAFECEAPTLTIAEHDMIGIDMGLKTLASTLNGVEDGEVPALKALKKHEQRLKRYQRAVSRRQKGSKRREAARRRVARLHQRIANLRKKTTRIRRLPLS